MTRPLGSEVAVDVLVDPAVSWAEVPAPGAVLEGAALVHVGRCVVLVLRDLTRVGSLEGVPPVRPGAECEVVERANVEVVAREGHGTVVELLVVRIRRDVADSRRRPRSGVAEVVRDGAPCVERGRRRPIRAIADRPSRAVAPVIPAVPPDRVDGAAERWGRVVGGDIRKDLVPGRLVV